MHSPARSSRPSVLLALAALLAPCAALHLPAAPLCAGTRRLAPRGSPIAAVPDDDEPAVASPDPVLPAPAPSSPAGKATGGMPTDFLGAPHWRWPLACTSAALATPLHHASPDGRRSALGAQASSTLPRPAARWGRRSLSRPRSAWCSRWSSSSTRTRRRRRSLARRGRRGWVGVVWAVSRFLSHMVDGTDLALHGKW